MKCNYEVMEKAMKKAESYGIKPFEANFEEDEIVITGDSTIIPDGFKVLEEPWYSKDEVIDEVKVEFIFKYSNVTSLSDKSIWNTYARTGDYYEKI
jgi:hypothetical protein